MATGVPSEGWSTNAKGERFRGYVHIEGPPRDCGRPMPPSDNPWWFSEEYADVLAQAEQHLRQALDRARVAATDGAWRRRGGETAELTHIYLALRMLQASEPPRLGRDDAAESD